MIAEKILGNLSESTPSVEVDTVELDWFEAEKKRIRKTTAGGRDIGIAIDESLKDGDIIYLDDKLCVAVKLTSCPLIKINVHTMQEMGRLCFEIGNRHLSLKISDDNVLIPHDEPTEKHLKNLGFECENIIGRFDEHSHETELIKNDRYRRTYAHSANMRQPFPSGCVHAFKRA